MIFTAKYQMHFNNNHAVQLYNIMSSRKRECLVQLLTANFWPTQGTHGRNVLKGRGGRTGESWVLYVCT